MSGCGFCLCAEGGLLLVVRLSVDSSTSSTFCLSLLPLLTSLHRSPDLSNGISMQSMYCICIYIVAVGQVDCVVSKNKEDKNQPDARCRGAVVLLS